MQDSVKHLLQREPKAENFIEHESTPALDKEAKTPFAGRLNQPCTDTGYKMFPRSIYLSLLLLFLVAINGCAWTDKSGSTHHLIIGLGFGIITTRNDAAVDIVDSRILGAEIGSFGTGIGLLLHHQIQIDPASNLVLSVENNPFNLTVKKFNMYSSSRRSQNHGRRGNESDENSQNVSTIGWFRSDLLSLQ